jgi:hypothetical protein
MGKKNKLLKTPSNNDWAGYENDLDLIDLHRLFYGKRIEEVYYYFAEGAYISRADELLYVSKSVFQYYIYAYALYLVSIGKNDHDAQEGFLYLLIHREKRDRGSVSHIFCTQHTFNIMDKYYKDKQFKVSLKKIVDMIEEQFAHEQIDNEIYDEIPTLIDEVKTSMKCEY